MREYSSLDDPVWVCFCNTEKTDKSNNNSETYISIWFGL